MSFEALFSSPTIIFWKVIFPPLFYGFHGWLATKMAVAALFRPYNPHYFLFTKIQIPLTPGIFPKRKTKLAQAVASTITETLLTAEDITHQAELLVTEENIYLAVNLFIESILREFRDIDKIHRLASDIADLSPAILEHIVNSLLSELENNESKKIGNILDKVFDEVILPARISYEQASNIAGRIMEELVTPQKVRMTLLGLLTPHNINSLEESIQTHASTAYKILARIIGVKRICYELKTFLETEPASAQELISDIIRRFAIKDQISVQIANFDLRSLPLQNIANLKSSFVTLTESFLVGHKQDILLAVSRIESEARQTVQEAIIHFNPATIPLTWIARAKKDFSGFAYAYLKREIGELISKALPKLGMYSLISNKIDLFSAPQLESLVQRICKNELWLLEILGGIIGLILGFFQIIVNAYIP